MRLEVPPPGPAMPFHQWSAAIVAGVRSYIPSVRAARKGDRCVVIRYDEREAHLRDEGSYWISFRSGSVATTMASMFDDRRDAFTVGNLARSIAGFFDGRFTIEQ